MAGRDAVERLDRLPRAVCVDALVPLFEGAPRFLSRLCDARPFGDMETLFARAREIARAMPEDEQVELVDAHPRLGAPPASVSPASFVEQGYGREAVRAAAEAEAEEERRRVARELDRLNAAYEGRFGFRYCVFVDGRPRSALLPGFEAALGADRAAELARAVEAVVDIAVDRHRRAGTAA